MRALFLLISGLLMGFSTPPVQAAKLSEREARKFMGLYLLNVRAEVTQNGVTTIANERIRSRMRWKPKPGASDVVQVPGGSYTSISERFKTGRRFLSVRRVYFGRAFDSGAGGFFVITGSSVQTLRKKGRRNYTATIDSQLRFGSHTLAIYHAKGKKIR
jgi:hypothetical protein